MGKVKNQTYKGEKLARTGGARFEIGTEWCSNAPTLSRFLPELGEKRGVQDGGLRTLEPNK
jgi:hypothetical protein